MSFPKFQIQSLPVINGLLLLSLLFQLACGGKTAQEQEVPIAPVEEALPTPSEPTFLPPSASIDTFREGTYVVYSVDPTQSEVRLFNRKTGGGVHDFTSVAQLAQEEGKTLQFLCNGGMFQEDRTALGLFMAEGEEQHRIDVRTEGYGNFFLQPNGVFAVDTTGQAVVMTTQDFAANNHQVWESATQSGPMMVIDGQINSLFNDGSPNLHIRNAVGITPEGRVIFAKSQQTVTFFELSSLMIQQGCSQALYLDGFVSQTYLPELGIGSLEAGTSLGPLIAVFDKSPAI